MGRLRLSTILIAVNVGLLLLALGGLALVAARLLQQLADEQAIARVRQAVDLAAREVGSATDGTLTSALLLAERSSLRRLVEDEDRQALVPFLAQFVEASGLAAAAVVADGEVVAGSDNTLPWSTLTASSPALVDVDDGPLLLVARAPVAGLPGAEVLVVRRLDEDFARRLGVELGLPVSIIEREAALKPPAAVLRSNAVLTGTTQAQRDEDRAAYVAVSPLLSAEGEVIGVVEAALPTISVVESGRQLRTTLLALALTLAILAVCASLLLGRRLTRPLETLTVAAARIGRGDLATPIPIAAGGEAGTLAVTLEDMRGRLLRLTDDLARQRAEAQAIVTGVVEGVFTVDRERRIRFLNPQAAAMLGIASGDAVGRFCGDVLRPADVDGKPPCAERCPIVHARFRDGARATEYLRLPDGSRRTVVITSAPPAERQQVQVMRDETEVEAARRLRDAILANISHEFRTPLSAQLASIELLLDQLPELSPAQIEQLVRAQQRGALRLRQLIDNLLESARIEAGQLTIRRRPLQLADVVDEALAIVGPLLEQRGQRADVRLPAELPVVVGDEPRLTQVLVNLLANANKFAPPDSVIQIGGAASGGLVSVWVADNGPGLPDGAGQALFERWSRAAGDEPEQSGVGLGLWLATSILERHGGRVEARNDDAGARVTIVLPEQIS